MKREYDPTIRPWYYKGANARGTPTVSTPFLKQSAGTGKVVTLAQALFEGTPPTPPPDFCSPKAAPAAGCVCAVAGASSGVLATAAGRNTGPVPRTTCGSTYCFEGKCTHEHIVGVLGLDFLYQTFEDRMVAHTVKAPDSSTGRSCGSLYTCGSGSSQGNCTTECYLLDESALMVMHHSLGKAADAAEVEYHDISLGELEGELMRQFSFRGLLKKETYYDFQGRCYKTPPRDLRANILSPRSTTQAEDNMDKFSGDFHAFSNVYGCQKQVVVHKLSMPDTAPTQSGTLDGPCDSGAWTLSRVPDTKLFLLVIDERREKTTPKDPKDRSKPIFSVSCHISNMIQKPGTFQIGNDTCSRQVDTTKSRLLPAERCASKVPSDFKCRLVAPAAALSPSGRQVVGIALLVFALIKLAAQ